MQYSWLPVTACSILSLLLTCVSIISQLCGLTQGPNQALKHKTRLQINHLQTQGVCNCLIGLVTFEEVTGIKVMSLKENVITHSANKVM